MHMPNRKFPGCVLQGVALNHFRIMRVGPGSCYSLHSHSGREPAISEAVVKGFSMIAG
jgi:hypothetical protein